MLADSLPPSLPGRDGAGSRSERALIEPSGKLTGETMTATVAALLPPGAIVMDEGIPAPGPTPPASRRRLRTAI
jgi:hypothetical protein